MTARPRMRAAGDTIRMAYIEIFPKSAEAQERLTAHCDAAMNLVAQTIKEVLDVPDHDIIVELNQCTTIRFNASAVDAAAVPDVVMKIATSDHHLQSKFEALGDQMVNSWNVLFGSEFKLEIWMNLIVAWRCNIDFE